MHLLVRAAALCGGIKVAPISQPEKHPWAMAAFATHQPAGVTRIPSQATTEQHLAGNPKRRQGDACQVATLGANH